MCYNKDVAVSQAGLARGLMEACLCVLVTCPVIITTNTWQFHQQGLCIDPRRGCKYQAWPVKRTAFSSPPFPGAENLRRSSMHVDTANLDTGYLLASSSH